MTQAEKKKFSELLEQTNGDESLATQLWVKWKCLTDLYYLGSVIFGLREATRYNRFSRRRKSVLDPKLHKWLATIIEQEEDKIILVPRRHLKSTWIKYRIIQRLIQNPNTRIALYSVTQNLGVAMLADIKRLAVTPLLMRLFPTVFVPMKEYEKNTEDKLTIKRDPELGHPPQECQVEVYGTGQVVTGRHFDEHYYDDLIDKDTVRTVDRMKKAREWYSYIQGVLEPDGMETITATPYHYADLYAEIIEDGIYEKVYRRPCIENGKPIYSFYTLKDLERIKKRMGNYIFSAQMMCDPSPVEDKIFPPPQPTFDLLPKGEYTWYICVDPAATVQTYSDETAIVVVAVNPIGWMYIVDAMSFKKPGNETARIIIELAEKYHPRSIGIEFGLQEHLKHIIQMVHKQAEQAKGAPIPLPIEGIKPGNTRKFDRVNWTFGSFVREKKIKIQENLKDLMTQMERFSPNYNGKDDLVDAVSLVFQIVHQFSYRSYAEPKGLIIKDHFTIEEIFKDMQKKKFSWKERTAV